MRRPQRLRPDSRRAILTHHRPRRDPSLLRDPHHHGAALVRPVDPGPGLAEPRHHLRRRVAELDQDHPPLYGELADYPRMCQFLSLLT